MAPGKGERVSGKQHRETRHGRGGTAGRIGYSRQRDRSAEGEHPGEEFSNISELRVNKNQDALLVRKEQVFS